MSTTNGTLTNFPNWIEGIANLAGFEVQKVCETLVAIRCDLPEGRTQTVWVRHVGKDPLDNTIVSISSPAMKMGRGQFLSQKQANDLLRQNTRLYHSAWAIENVEGDDYLVMFDTQIAETMDTQEFAASVRVTAVMADDLEAQMGRDNF